MKESYYFSRNYVEFGTFSAKEIADFRKRGILTDHDYIRAEDTHHWETVGHWLSKNGNAKPEPKAKAPRKKAAATKASKKAA